MAYVHDICLQGPITVINAWNRCVTSYTEDLAQCNVFQKCNSPRPPLTESVACITHMTDEGISLHAMSAVTYTSQFQKWNNHQRMKFKIIDKNFVHECDFGGNILLNQHGQLSAACTLSSLPVLKPFARVSSWTGQRARSRLHELVNVLCLGLSKIYMMLSALLLAYARLCGLLEEQYVQ